MFGLPIVFYTIVGSTFTGAAPWTFTAPAQASVAETIAVFKVADDATAKFEIKNGSSTDGLFIPKITGTGNGGNYALWVEAAGGTDTGSNPMLLLSSANVATRPAFGFFSGALFTTVSGKGAWTYTVQATASVAETLAIWSVSDDAVGKIEFMNGFGSDATFAPLVKFTGPSTAQALYMRADITTDTGNAAAMQFNVRIVGNTAVVVRPLYEWGNNGTQVLQLLPLNSGANGALVFTSTSGTGAPTFGAATRSIGTRYVIYPNQAAGTVDGGMGVESGGIWFSTFTNANTNQFRWYGGTTGILTLLGDGTMDLVTGGMLVRGATVRSVGPAIEVLMSNPNGSINSYDRSTATWKNLALQASAITFTISAATVMTISATGVASAQPIGFPSYTVAGVPSAALAGQQIYVSNESGGAVLAFSDGTNWRRVTDRAIIS